MRRKSTRPRRAGRRLLFFFQAEDGIRDVAVTGVQTCALPILIRDPRPLRPLGKREGNRVSDEQDHEGRQRLREGKQEVDEGVTRPARDEQVAPRSEERRVGKECRYGWSLNHEKKKYPT